MTYLLKALDRLYAHSVEYGQFTGGNMKVVDYSSLHEFVSKHQSLSSDTPQCWFYTINDGDESKKAYPTRYDAIEAAKQEMYEEYGTDCLGIPYEVYTKGEYLYITEEDLR